MTAHIKTDELTASQPVLILCVDDEPNVLAALRRLFRSHGWRILVAQSGREGLDILQEHKASVVISDMQMPEMNGVQFLEQVRLHSPDSIRLMLTGHGDMRAINDAVSRGVIFRHISKPWDDGDLLSAVREAMEYRTLSQAR